MTKKFDVVIGNPPYNEDTIGDSTHNMPVYHQFMDAAYEVGRSAVLITPARFLFDAGYTPKVWNRRMLADPHLSVAYYTDDPDSLFPGTGIEGGIVVTLWDSERTGKAIGTFTRFPELNQILGKVNLPEVGSLTPCITSSRSYRYTEVMHKDHPEAAELMSDGEQFKINTRTFDQLSFLYSIERPSDGYQYSRVLGRIGNVRSLRWIRSDYISGPDNFHAHKVAVPASNGSADLGGIGAPVLLEPNVAVTQTFLTIGSFESRTEGQACLKYVQSKFARALVGVLKITQHNPARVWKHVPLQDFTSESDIDWTRTVPEIDQQLYAKYGLSDEEIEFIETHVKPME